MVLQLRLIPEKIQVKCVKYKLLCKFKVKVMKYFKLDENISSQYILLVMGQRRMCS